MDILIPKQIFVIDPPISNVPESTNPEWSAGTSYALDALVKRSASEPPSLVTHDYKSLVAANLGNDPTATTGKWLDLGPSQRWAMFDDKGGTVTTMTDNAVPTWDFDIDFSKGDLAKTVGATTTVYQSLHDSNLNHAVTDPAWWKVLWTTSDPDVGAHITTDFYTPDIDAVAFFGVSASMVYAHAAGYDFSTYELAGREDVLINIRPPGEYTPISDTVATTFVDCSILTAGAGASAKCGNLIPCRRLATIGQAEFGADTGILDFSKKITDDFGATTLVKGAWSKAVNLQLIVPTSEFNKVYRLLASIRGQAVVWHETAGDFEPLLIYGFFREFRLVLKDAAECTCSLQIEGMT